jgi:hypothetical protein
MNLHPQFIGQDGTDEYVVLPIEESRAVVEALEDDQDLQDIRNAKKAEATEATAWLAGVVEQLNRESG